ncbi:MAG: bifunctional folylpolyglutamate synthase/dihydrofolate synthase [Lachnospiraceae bacterium]|nr:bifunctional folylpolyglutamate synthase/dihydrofolate synthase [Lachnospiraceae bacterium]
MTYTEAENYLNDIPKFSKKTTPENTRAILATLGHPEAEQRFIHVAGTNGKGSVCAFTAQALMDNGYKVGMFTSPHLVRINERFKINGQDIDDETMLKAFHQVYELFQGGHPELVHASYFEFIFLMGMLIFAWEKVDYTVLEVGLGGRLDATNVVEKPEVCVIASISLDHTEFLGDTPAQIASEKAGIIKAGVPVVYDANDADAAAVIAAKAVEMGSPAYPVSREDILITRADNDGVAYRFKNKAFDETEYCVRSVATYQAMNSALALTALKVAFPGLKDLDKSIAKTQWGGRMEQVLPGVYLDGGHNADGIAKFLETAHRLTCPGKKYLMFSVVVEKDYDKMIAELCEKSDFAGIVLAQMESYRALDVKEMYDTFIEHTKAPVIAGESVEAGLKKALEIKGQEDILFIAGSLYLVGEVKEALKALS